MSHVYLMEGSMCVCVLNFFDMNVKPPAIVSSRCFLSLAGNGPPLSARSVATIRNLERWPTMLKTKGNRERVTKWKYV